MNVMLLGQGQTLHNDESVKMKPVYIVIIIICKWNKHEYYTLHLLKSYTKLY